MMRNYRGLTKDGRGVYGWYVHDVEWGKHYIYNSIDFKQGAFYVLGRYEVRPETIGQSTGLKDKNGKEGYFDYILETDDGHIGVVKWSEEKLRVYFEWNDGKITYPSEHYDIVGFTFIGNIHQNKDLLND